ncbi:MAG: hypothetical protein LBG87_01285 [Spirochaetaceae bacterium]|jgi:hypothetical protein|nr:hypothetical protein [Spirochaetaceae bacterium]
MNRTARRRISVFTNREVAFCNSAPADWVFPAFYSASLAFFPASLALKYPSLPRNKVFPAFCSASLALKYLPPPRNKVFPALKQEEPFLGLSGKNAPAGGGRIRGD